MNDDELGRMLKTLKSELEEMSVQLDRIHSDLYAPSGKKGETFMQRVRATVEDRELAVIGFKVTRWVIIGTAAFVVGWAQFKDALLTLLGPPR